MSILIVKFASIAFDRLLAISAAREIARVHVAAYSSLASHRGASVERDNVAASVAPKLRRREKRAGSCISCLCRFLHWPLARAYSTEGPTVRVECRSGPTCCLAATGKPSTQALYEAAIGILIVDFLLWDAEGCRPGECWLNASFVAPEHNVQLW